VRECCRSPEDRARSSSFELKGMRRAVNADAVPGATSQASQSSELSAGGSRELKDDLARLRSGMRDAPRAARRRWGRWILAVALLAAAAAYAVRNDLWSEPPNVQVVVVTQRELGLPPVVLSAVGYVVPEREITVAAAIQGRLVEMPVAENQTVAAGGLLARLESREAQANLALAETARSEAERELQLVRELVEVGVRTRVELDRARTAFEQADARLRLARTALENTVLRAPFEGTVIRKLRDVGELLTLGVTAQGDPGTAIAVLADLDPLYVALEINEAEIRKLSEGMVALVAPEAQPDRRYLGDLVEIAARADRNKGVVAARVRIRDADAELLPNMTVAVRFVRQAPSGEIVARPSLPRSALTRRDGRDVVFVVEDERVEPVAVRLDPRVESRKTEEFAFSAVVSAPGDPVEFVALLEGPGEGAYVVDSPPATLRAGSAVRTAP